MNKKMSEEEWYLSYEDTPEPTSGEKKSVPGMAGVTIEILGFPADESERLNKITQTATDLKAAFPDTLK